MQIGEDLAKQETGDKYPQNLQNYFHPTAQIKHSAKMDRFRVWVEASRSASSPCGNRPPPVRTSHTYDDDDTFNQVALNLLSRYSALGISTCDTIKMTLPQPHDRVSFFDGLQTRRCRPTLSPLVDNIDKTFGLDLKTIVDAECLGIKTLRHGDMPPITPRHIQGPTSSSSCSASQPSYNEAPKKRKNRRFFPDCDSSNGLFRSRRVQNIDWKLTEVVSQVQTLRLDGTSESFARGEYEPPSI
jgi:hypothetical protein